MYLENTEKIKLTCPWVGGGTVSLFILFDIRMNKWWLIYKLQ